MKFVDALGRVERFQAKQQHMAATGPYVSKKKKKQAQDASSDQTPKSLKEMLMGIWIQM